ncbi:pentapeptide repeat-containing protein [Anaerobaca lacustris]|uniref:Pentapeptide repeat-containing protein n=1 Tax=Anaerobaca lacustris TaxID=3044600 RepID=A0AAW6U322_9BACT|nr:pentapeptide repeat-containing protein [Sedimentisphaerales bacterium M17dextr]
MANPEHLAILKQGVEAWNQWRTQNSGIEAELSGTSIAQLPLGGIDLRSANLSKAYAARQILNRTDLTGANLSGADLSESIVLRGQLSRANLMGANLQRALLLGADLTAVDLRSTQLFSANFGHAILRNSRLDDADMRQSLFAGADLSGAVLTGAKLYGTARDDWIIDGVECRYVFWDIEGKIRCPVDRDFAPGEFEQIYKSLPIIEYVFQNGMTPLDALVMDRVVQAIRDQNPDYDLKIDSINARGLTPSIRFTVQQEEQKGSALQMIVAGYEDRLRRLEGEKDRLYDLLELAIDKAGTKLLVAGPGAVVATDGSTINIDQHVENITNLRDTVAALPEDSPAFAKVAKKTALGIIGDALKDVAKGQVMEAAKQIYELGKDLGPAIVNTAAYAYFRSHMPGG